MRRRIMLTAVEAAAATLTSLGISAASAAAPAPAVPGAGGAQLWVARYNGPGNGDDSARSVAVSPAGARVFVTGGSADRTTGDDYATVAYSAATGKQLWASRYSGPQHSDKASSVAVAPRGNAVFVTGESGGQNTFDDYATVAYNAATGKQLWARRYSGGRDFSAATSVVVSPNGRTVFVTGTNQNVSEQAISGDYATVAYNAATGRQLWVSRYSGPVLSLNYASSLAMSPRGTAVFVTGFSESQTGNSDYATVAYNAATGRQLWARRYTGPGNGASAASSVAASPAGTAVFVTGYSASRTTGKDYATIAYNAATGRQLWVSRYTGPGNGSDAATSVAVSRGGTAVFVTGQSFRGSASDYATIAYNAASGRLLWARRYSGGDNGADAASALAVSPQGAAVFVTGTSLSRRTGYDYATVAYSATSGRLLWARRYNGPANGADAASSVAVSPQGATVFVTGTSPGRRTGDDYATVAYHT